MFMCECLCRKPNVKERERESKQKVESVYKRKRRR